MATSSIKIFIEDETADDTVYKMKVKVPGWSLVELQIAEKQPLMTTRFILNTLYTDMIIVYRAVYLRKNYDERPCSIYTVVYWFYN